MFYYSHILPYKEKCRTPWQPCFSNKINNFPTHQTYNLHQFYEQISFKSHNKCGLYSVNKVSLYVYKDKCPALFAAMLFKQTETFSNSLIYSQ